MEHSPKVKCYLDKDNRFIIENYHLARPFSNFFPGIAGLWGIPMWVFYTNRGQAVMSFGIENKSKAIMEFQPANKAYRLVSHYGFRTFLKISRKNKQDIFYEPFQGLMPSKTERRKTKMAISSHDVTITEEYLPVGLRISVNYFTLPQESFAALIRQVTIENLSSGTLVIDMVDGMPAIVPYGFNDFLLKHLSRTIEAWVTVDNLSHKAPFYRLKVDPSDSARVEHIDEGNFYFSFVPKGKKGYLADAIIDPRLIFGEMTDFSIPKKFLTKNFHLPEKQIMCNATPCAMGYLNFRLPKKGKQRFISVVGHMEDPQKLNAFIRKNLNESYIAKKAIENRDIINRIKLYACTVSSSREFDAYCQQTFLDNVLRGGLPISLESDNGKVSFNVFSRKHGDPERDYNDFVLAPTYFSQGNGNYRDVNQNRRNDIWFNQDVKDSSIISFFSLIQADGYNPLVVHGTSFFPKEPDKLDSLLADFVKEKDRPFVKDVMINGFSPGKLIYTLQQKKIKLKTSLRIFLKSILGHCYKQELATHGEGFWSDHWTYSLDLVERYLALYPETLEEILLTKREISFYRNTHYVLPRNERYVLTSRGGRQYYSVFQDEGDTPSEGDHKLRIHKGEGPVYYTNLMVKILCILANKVATLDPSGLGIEMEGGRPNWYDALNGLPGLLGSSLSETFELRRFAQFVLDSLNKLSLDSSYEIDVYEELFTFIENLKEILSQKIDGYTYWNCANEIKEHYRQRVRKGLDGQEKRISIREIKQFCSLIIKKADKAIRTCRRPDGTFPTYFTHEITAYEKLDKKTEEDFPYIWPLKFKRHELPLFLEGFVHAMRVEQDSQQLKKIYTGVRRSSLFDKKLKMYRVNANLLGESEEIGRTHIFPPGWLENQSIWSHMEYKYLLELLRKGLHDEFYKDFRKILVPFQDPIQYGRNILENSSFIVSSVHPDESLHGQGFVARLSGTTAEFVHIWLVMNVGERPFFLDKRGRLFLKFSPILPGWLFTKERRNIDFIDSYRVELPPNTYAFNFLNSTLVVYHNPKRKNTYGSNRVVIKKIEIFYTHRKREEIIEGDVIGSPLAKEIREGKIQRIDVYFG